MTPEQYRTVPEERILALLRLGGWAYAPDGEQALAALLSWVEGGLGVRVGAAGQRQYDPVEVINFFKTAGRAGRDTFWAQQWVATGRRLVADLHGIDRFSVECQRWFPAPRSARLRAPLPLPGGDLEIDVDAAGEVRTSPGRLEARIVEISGDVVLRSRSRFTATPHRPTPPAEKLSAATQSLYLRPREGLIVVSEAVAALARRLAGPGISAPRAVANFWNYLIDELLCGAIHYDQVDPAAPCDWALAGGIVDCQLGSALLIALCRAIDIPARLVSGHLLYRLAPTNHYWAEIWLDETGWTPVDLLSWDLSLGGRDVAWRDHFFGQLDARMTTQRLPLAFTGAVGVQIPAAWHLLQSSTPDGIEIDLVDLTGRSIYRDRVSVAGQASVTRSGTEGCVERSASRSRSSIAEPSSR